MSEDVSATMRVGVTVILVAALVATVLNLMVMSNSLISQGQSSLQSGVESVSAQEFAPYDNQKVSGVQVRTALDLFSTRDIAVVIQTKSIANEAGEEWALNYCALVTSDGKSSTDSNLPTEYNVENNPQSPWNTIVSDRAPIVVPITFGEAGSNCALQRESGGLYYEATLHNTGGMIDVNYNDRSARDKSCPGYVLDSSRFTSTLIKDSNGSTIGIFFKQVK